MKKAILSPNGNKLYPCNVDVVRIKSGESVRRGEVLFTLRTTDGRKTQSICAPFEGVVEDVLCVRGQRLDARSRVLVMSEMCHEENSSQPEDQLNVGESIEGSIAKPELRRTKGFAFGVAILAPITLLILFGWSPFNKMFFKTEDSPIATEVTREATDVIQESGYQSVNDVFQESGYQTINFANGDRYEGYVWNGTLSGTGTLYKSDGQIIKGRWADGALYAEITAAPTSTITPARPEPVITVEPEPEFKTVEHSNGRYEGYMLNGQRNGQGTYTFTSGVSYVGIWKDGNISGDGIVYFANGTIKYEGEFLEGEYSGYGKLYKDIGFLQYQGNFENGRFHGFGIQYTLRGGTVRVGQFSNGKLTDDNGEIYFKSGGACKGLMIDGRLIVGSGYTSTGASAVCFRNDNDNLAFDRPTYCYEILYSATEELRECVRNFWRFQRYPRPLYSNFYFPIDYASNR